jgi:DNA-binding XRE family transcriptional regulator
MTKLRQMRKEQGLRSIDLCCAIGLHPVTVSAVENRRVVPGASARAKLCAFFGVKEDDVFDENGLAAM